MAAPSKSIVKATLLIIRTRGDPPGSEPASWRVATSPATGKAAAAMTSFAASSAGAAVSTGGSDASSLSSASRTLADLLTCFTTQACQPARTRLYCDLGTARDEGFLIWNHA